MKKYELLPEDTIEINGTTLYRIKAIRNFATVKVGQLGGYIEKEENLSHDGECWVYDDAKVFGNANICNNTKVFENAMIYSDSQIQDNINVCDDVCVHGEINISGSGYLTSKNHLKIKKK